ncbi:hypothetical protein MITSMUL_03799 [Mitsuokella multacida DSM 20544]|uniref:Uncharacterized protein n=1 Tax=Mitsuokella multacida DSM 20544 TaxID=500635 RepID=C9KKV0_9FIRM|nr:hypothetical protein MITSMUL_03799 [Mitsuokella multacida DSM 20544]
MVRKIFTIQQLLLLRLQVYILSLISDYSKARGVQKKDQPDWTGL